MLFTMPKEKIDLKFLVRIALAIISVCVFSCIFSFVIGYINDFVRNRPNLLFLLPLGCFAIFALKSYDLNPAFFKVVTTWISHFCGASVGKEGVGLFLGQSVSEHILDKRDDDVPVIIGVSSAFASLFVSPLAGVAFVFEHALRKKKIGIFYLSIAVISSLCSCVIAHAIGVHAFRFVRLSSSDFNTTSLYATALSVLLVFAVVKLYDIAKKALKKNNFSENFKPSFLISLMILVLSLLVYRLTGDRNVNSLSVSLLSNFEFAPEFRIVIIYIIAKAVLTLLSISSGFTGGEFVPLVVIGAYCAVAVCKLFGIISPLAISFSAFAALAFGMNIPITALFLEAELAVFSFLGL